MSLSILIPTYNHDLHPLAQALDKQCKDAGITYEIRCCDDASDHTWQTRNRSVRELKNVHYEALPENKGVCYVRNKLADEARYPNLLFLDGDMHIYTGDFIKRYLPHFDRREVVYGGITYPANPPVDRSKHLRWHYGKEREEKPVAVRNEHPHLHFMTQNVLIPKEVFDKVRFEERLPHPGHDDTWFGFQLKQAGMPVRHIDNPADHTGIPAVEAFFTKTEQAIDNLVRLLQWYPEEKSAFIHYVRLLQQYHKLSRVGVLPLLVYSYPLFRRLVRANLASRKPSLRLLDWYKLVRLYKRWEEID